MKLLRTLVGLLLEAACIPCRWISAVKGFGPSRVAELDATGLGSRQRSLRALGYLGALLLGDGSINMQHKTARRSGTR